MSAHDVAHGRGWEVAAAFTFGATFLAVILVVAFYKPNPTPFEYTVFRIIIAVAAAGVGAVLPGFLDVRFKTWLRAGGASALFVIVYFFAPAAASLSDGQLGPGPSTDAKVKAEEWLTLVDQGNLKNAYKSMAESFKTRYPFDQVEQIVARERNSLGKMTERTFISSAPWESPPGAPRGVYRQYVFAAAFQNEIEPIYETIWLVGENDDWRVCGFYTMVKTQSGQFVPYDPKSE
jgi:hypothetical protein